MSEKKKGDVSIANVLAIIGLAGLGVITFLGEMLKSTDGRPTRAIIFAVVYVGLLALFLIFSIKAKGASDNPDKWRYAEWFCIAAYVAVAILGSSPFHHFFSVVSQKQELQEMANNQVNAVKKMYDDYNIQCDNYLKSAVERMSAYKRNPQSRSIKDDLYEYVEGHFAHDSSWYNNSRLIVRADEKDNIEDITKRIKKWNYMQLSSLASDIDGLVNTSRRKLESRIDLFKREHNLIPLIGVPGEDGRTQYTYDGLAEFDLGPELSGEMVSKLSSDSGKSVLGWIVFALLHLIVLFNYLVAPRTYIVGPGRRSEDQSGGASL